MDDVGADATSPVVRSLDVLRAIVQSEHPVSLTDLTNQLGLPSSTVHRLVGLLRRQDMVAFDASAKLYTPGEDLLRMGLVLSSRWDTSALVRPALAEIVRECNETAQFSRFLADSNQMMAVEQVRCTQPLQFALPLYEPQPLLWGSSGRVILAQLGEPLVAAVLAAAQPAPATGQPVPSAADLADRLAVIRDRGWDRTDGEKLSFAVGFAAPVFDRAGVAGSVHVPIPAARYREEDGERVRQAVVAAAIRITRLLGGTSRPAGA